MAAQRGMVLAAIWVLAMPFYWAQAWSSSSTTASASTTTPPPRSTVTGVAGTIEENNTFRPYPTAAYQKPLPPNGLDVAQPNMILFMPDQLRFDAVGIFGNEIVQTPNLDAFAAEATRFTNTFVQASTCSQSRCSMFTGQYPHVSGHRSLENLLKPWEPNVFRSLREAGYHVAYLAPRGDFYAENATELGVNEYGFLTDQTLPEFSSESYNTEDKNDLWNRLYYLGKRNETEAMDYDAALIRGALNWLEHPPTDKPWVLFLPLMFPHCPWTVEEPWFSLHNRSEIPLPPRPEDRTGHSPRFFQAIRDQHGLERANDTIWQEVIATYYGMVSRIDNQFGRIVNKTKEQNLWDSTITFFFTDHGEFLGDYHLIEKWPSGVSSNLVHEPLLIGGGGLPKNITYPEMAEMIDLVPTMLQLASLNDTYMHSGLSLLNAIHAAGKGEIIPHRNYSYTEGGFLLTDEPLLEQGPFPYDIKSALQHNDTALVGQALAVRNKEWTYVYRLYEADELYSRKGDDIHEMYNLAAQPEFQGVRAQMREVALKFLFETPANMPFYLDVRKPASVGLKSPIEQYRERCGEDCEFDGDWGIRDEL